MSDCPICPPGTCKGYVALWERLAKDRDRYMPAHAIQNMGEDERNAIIAARLTAENPPRGLMGLGGCCGG